VEYRKSKDNAFEGRKPQSDQSFEIGIREKSKNFRFPGDSDSLGRKVHGCFTLKNISTAESESRRRNPQHCTRN
jgi:hypothetical protein